MKKNIGTKLCLYPMPVAVIGSVIQNYEIDGFDNFICESKAVYVEDKYLINNQIDYQKFKPVLFEFPAYQYLLTGKVLGKCISFIK